MSNRSLESKKNQRNSNPVTFTPSLVRTVTERIAQRHISQEGKKNLKISTISVDRTANALFLPCFALQFSIIFVFHSLVYSIERKYNEKKKGRDGLENIEIQIFGN